MLKPNLFVSVSSPGSVPSPYGQGSGVIRITSVTCSGSENNVIRCSLSMGSSSNHQNDVGVKCGKGYTDTITNEKDILCGMAVKQNLLCVYF